MADAKLDALRQWLGAEMLDAYLVPHSDRFQSEYLPPEDERLAWLTGFTGSAGMAAILPDKAALFTDGRYTLQALQQLDTAVFDIVEAPPETPLAWMKIHLAKGARIGFDPWLFTVAQMNVWQRGAHENQWELVAMGANPVDVLWQDKPVQKITAARPHDLDYAGVATGDKTSAILARKTPAARHVLISDPSLVCWLLNMRGNDVAHTPLVQSVALLDQDGHITLFTDPRKIPDVLRKIWGNHVSVEALENLQDALGGLQAPLQIDPGQCAFAVKDFCVEHAVAVVEAADPALLLRACKNAVEIAGAQIAHDKDAVAFRGFIDWFNARDFDAEQVTEADIVARLRACRMADADCRDESFDTIAGYGPNGAIVHYRVDDHSNLRLQPGGLLLLDSGGQYAMGTTDVTRVLPVGQPSAQMKRHYTAVLKGLIALSSSRFPAGATGAQLDALARAPIWALGLDYAHGTGHGVGSYLSVHEGPQGISSRSATPLQPGMILSIEPGIYLAGEYGIRLENLVVVVEDNRPEDAMPMLAFRTLTRVPFDGRLIDHDDLDPLERAFLQQFQA